MNAASIEYYDDKYKTTFKSTVHERKRRHISFGKCVENAIKDIPELQPQTPRKQARIVSIAEATHA